MRVRPRVPPARLHLRDAEIEHLHEGRTADRVREEEVLGLQIAMDDAERMRLGERFARLDDVVHDVADRQRRLLVDEGAQGRAAQELHHHVRCAVGERTDVDDACDVLAPEAHDGAGFAEEALERLAAAERVRTHELDGHDLPELHVLGSDDDTHTARPDHAVDAVLPREDLAYLDWDHRRQHCIHDARENRARRALGKMRSSLATQGRSRLPR